MSSKYFLSLVQHASGEVHKYKGSLEKKTHQFIKILFFGDRQAELFCE